VYDEFGSCFLLAMACVRRFGLELDTDATRFIAEIMSINDRPRRHGDLDEAQSAHLNEWIKALYEDEGISDELMSTCPPQEFYKIVGTLFRVSLNAYKNGALSKDKLHSGLEREC
jgi:mediator of RNA polymerase II transcription subunit 5